MSKRVRLIEDEIDDEPLSPLKTIAPLSPRESVFLGNQFPSRNLDAEFVLPRARPPPRYPRRDFVLPRALRMPRRSTKKSRRSYKPRRSYTRRSTYVRGGIKGAYFLIDPKTGEKFEYGATGYGITPRLASTEEMGARLRKGYRGYGDYMSTAAGLYGAARMAAPYVGQAFRGIQSAVRRRRNRLNGLGDYGAAVDNQIIETSDNPPLSVNGADDLSGDVLINHREFVTNITAATSSFENRLFSINPGLPGVFPFLSQIAKNFTLYEFMGLIFEYRPTSGETGQTNNALGKVIMAVNYDPDAPAFSSSIQMENYDYATSAKPSVEQRCGVETKPQQQALRMQYVRTTDATTRDKIFTDIGLFQLATEGIPAAGTVGELWVTYQIKVSRALLFDSAIGGGILTDMFVAVPSTTMVNGNTAAYSSYPGVLAAYTLPTNSTLASPRIGNTIGGTVSSSTLDNWVYTFPSDVAVGAVFVLFASFQLATNAGVGWSPPTVTNGSLVTGNAFMQGPTSIPNTTFGAGYQATDINDSAAASKDAASILFCTVKIATSNNNQCSVSFTATDDLAFQSSSGWSLLVQQVNSVALSFP